MIPWLIDAGDAVTGDEKRVTSSMDQKTQLQQTPAAPQQTGPHLFRPIAFRSVTARNRIMVSPMCQYSATDGLANDWHFQNLASRAVGGAGIVFVEMTNVEARGRITAGCMGLWNDAQRDALARIAGFVKSQGAVAGIQLAHAGRKASTARPWEGGKGLKPEQGGWPIIGPSATQRASSSRLSRVCFGLR